LLTKKEGRRRWRETKKNKGNTKEEKQEETSSWQREKQFAPKKYTTKRTRSERAKERAEGPSSTNTNEHATQFQRRQRCQRRGRRQQR